MKKQNYEQPRFDFMELKLMERVAEECWGKGTAFLDVNKNGVIDPVDLQIDLSGGCKGNAAAEAINQWFINNGFEDPHYGANVCNTKESGFIVPVS